MNIPERIKEFLTEKKQNSNSPCDQCNSDCCKGPGFAIFENIKNIYEKYERGELIRSDYNFQTDLSLSQFIFKYFDRASLNGGLLIFFPKVLTEDDQLLSVPPWNYWQARDYLFKRYKTYGCIFLDKRKIDGDYSINKCILHNNHVEDQITEKPIDCLFLHCNGIRNIVNPRQVESNLWFSLLDYHFPNSVNIFNQQFPELRE